MKTPEQHFKELSTQLEENENGDSFFTGDIRETFALLKKLEAVDGYRVEQSTPYYLLYSDCGSYWGSGPTLEMAQRYLIGAVLTS